MRVVLQRLDDILDHFLGVGEEHHGVVFIEKIVVDPGVAGRHGAFHEEDRARLVDIEDRHAEDRAGRVIAGGGVGHVVRADHQRRRSQS